MSHQKPHLLTRQTFHLHSHSDPGEIPRRNWRPAPFERNHLSLRTNGFAQVAETTCFLRSQLRKA